MAPKLDRLLNLSAYIFCSIILTCLILLTPADAIYQCYKTHRLINIFFIAGAYIITFLLAVLIYATRIYTNRRALTGIPKAWIPVEKEDVGSSVRRLVMDGLSRSAMIAYQARPRDLSDNKNNSSSSNNNNGNGNNNETTNAEKYTDPSLLIDRTRPPPWGVIEHPGWSSPASSSSLTGEDLLPPDTPYRTVIQELPYLIEAKAVSLAPPDPVFTASTAGGYDGPIPDTRVVEVLQRAAHMGVREYIVHLSSLDVVRPAEIAAEFVALYERARFSAHELYEAEFRELMRVFADVLRGMVLDAGVVEDIHARSFTSSTTTSTSPPSTTATTTTTSSSASGSRLSLASESVIGPSDEEGETDTVDYHSSSSRRSPWSDQRQQHPYQSLITPRTPSVRSLHRMRSTASASSAASSGGSVIRHVDYR